MKVNPAYEAQSFPPSFHPIQCGGVFWATLAETTEYIAEGILKKLSRVIYGESIKKLRGNFWNKLLENNNLIPEVILAEVPAGIPGSFGAQIMEKFFEWHS